MHLARRGAADRRAAVHRARHRRRGAGREALPRRRDPLGPARAPARVRQPGTGRRGARGPPGGADADARARRGAGARGRRHPAARRVRRAVLAVGRPPRLGRRSRELGEPVHGDAVARRLHAARARRGRGAGRGVRPTDRAARRREPVLHHRDDRDAAAPGEGPLGRHRPAAAGAAAADRAGRDRGADRPPLAAGTGPDPQGLGVRPVLVHARRARPGRRAERRGARTARGGGAARARRRPARTLALQPRHAARRRLREPPQARAHAPAPAGGRRVRQPGDRGPPPAGDRVPPRAGGPGGARPQPARPDARRTRGRRAGERRRHRARGRT